MRKQRVVLKHCVHGALVCGQFRDLISKRKNSTFGDVFKTSNHAQQRGFPKARGTQKSEKFLVPYAKRNFTGR